MWGARSRRWTEKPASPIGIELGHPLMLGLVHCVLFNSGGHPVDLASGIPLSVTGSPTWHALGLNLTGGASYNVRPPPQARSICTSGFYLNQFSFRIVHIPATWPGTYTTMLSRVAAGINEISLFVNTSGNIQYVSALDTDTDSVAIATAMTAGREWDFVVTLNASGILTGYTNGVLKGTKTVGVGTLTTTADMRLGQDGANSNYNGVWILFQYWHRCLTPTEVRELALNRYAGLSVSRLSRWALNAIVDAAMLKPPYLVKQAVNRAGTY